MQFNILTLFPETVNCFFKESILKRAIEKRVISIRLINIRDYSCEMHKKVDDYPFGGGSGMVLTADPIFRAFEDIDERGRVIYVSPAGSPLTQEKVRNLKRNDTMTILCGHYEGVDQRVIDRWVDEEISIGDYVVTGGEVAAAVMIDAITRELSQALGNENSKLEESFDDTGLLEYEQYTRPESYRDYKVPAVLLSGNHQEIRRWRIKRRLVNTLKKRPELLCRESLSEEYREILEEIEKEQRK